MSNPTPISLVSIASLVTARYAESNVSMKTPPCEREPIVKVLDGLEAVDPPFRQSVLTIGNFDGVHRGHQQLLAQAGLFAADTRGPVIVLTFEPHPLCVVAPGKAPPRLSLPEEKLRLLQQAGADVTVVARSEPSLLGLEAEQFINDIILDRFNPTHIVEGPSFGFGKGRRGTPELLQRVAAGAGCDVHILEPVKLKLDQAETLLVSSSLIRRLVKEGKVRRAALCLGRPYALIGKVVLGKRRGRALGFPTANLAVGDQLVPADGVYAGRVKVGDRHHAAAISIGKTPTFEGGRRQIEAHLLDFEDDLYDTTIRLEFDRWLRKQQRFESAGALLRQLQLDVESVRNPTDSWSRGGRREGADVS